VGAFGGSLTHFARTYFTLDQTITENVDVVLREFWEIDSSGMGNLPVLSVNNKMVIDKPESSIKFVDGHYQVAIPWKDDRLSLPNSFKMAFQRLQTLEKRLMRSPEIAVNYNQVIENHLEKGYVRKIEPCIVEQHRDNDKWYLPHFAVVKDGRTTSRIRVVFDAAAKCNGIALNDMIHPGPKLQQYVWCLTLLLSAMG